MNNKSKVIKTLRAENFWPNGGYGYKVFLRKYIFDRQTGEYIGYLKGDKIICLDEQFHQVIKMKRNWMVKIYE